MKTVDRRQLGQVAGAGQVRQRVAKRAQALLALERGERSVESVHGTGVKRTGLWRRYQQRGLEAIFDV